MNEVKLFVGQENGGYKVVDLQTTTSEEIKIDVEKVGKPVKVVGGMCIPSDLGLEAAGEGDRGIVLCYASKLHFCQFLYYVVLMMLQRWVY